MRETLCNDNNANDKEDQTVIYRYVNK